MKKIIIEWLKQSIYESFDMIMFEKQIVTFGQVTFGLSHSANSYARIFRQLKESGDLAVYDLKLTELPTTGNFKRYYVEPI